MTIVYVGGIHRVFICLCMCTNSSTDPQIIGSISTCVGFINHALSRVSGLVQKFAGVHQLMTMLYIYMYVIVCATSEQT